jgi:uncharacterized protein (DUF1778 family)
MRPAVAFQDTFAVMENWAPPRRQERQEKKFFALLAFLAVHTCASLIIVYPHSLRNTPLMNPARPASDERCAVDVAAILRREERLTSDFRCPCSWTDIVWQEGAMIPTAFLVGSAAFGRELANEKHSERMEQRVKPLVKQTIEMAAALSGSETSEFVTMAAFQAALDRIQSMRKTALDAEDTRRFFAVIDAASGPNAAMRELMADYQDGLVENQAQA